MAKQHKLAADTMLTADGKPVKAGDPAGVRWLGLKGSTIPEDQAKALGLIKPKKAPAKPKETD